MYRSHTWSRFILAAVIATLAVFVLVGCPGKTGQPPSAIETKQSNGVTALFRPAHQAPIPEDFDTHLSLSMNPDKNAIRWHNLSGASVTIDFPDWIFTEPKQSITIADKEFSDYFHLDPSKKPGQYKYKLTPDIGDNGGGPTDPSVSADP